MAAACSAPPKRPLQPGYYIVDARRIGVTRRIIIVAGDRRASYDVWRVSRTGDGTAKHAHYDLIASDDMPSSGDFAITQDGSDCGTLSIEPYRSGDLVDDSVLTVRSGLGIEHFHLLGPSDTERDRQYDDAVTRGIVATSSDDPSLYEHLSIFTRFFYSELTPRCTYD